MSRKLNNKGFTLVELLAVLVILIAIMGIAIPTISSSLERTKAKQNESRQKVLLSMAELYVTDYKNSIYNRLGTNDKCAIQIGSLSDYLSDEEMKDADGNDWKGKYIVFTKPNNYVFSEDDQGLDSCL